MLKVDTLITGIQSPETRILHSNISFELKAGEILLLVGTNGIGKSIFLKTILGHFKAMGGNITLANNNIPKLDHASRASLISLMLATPPQIEFMSGFEVALTGRQRFLSSWDSNLEIHENTTRSFARKFGIEALLPKRFSLMSDGEKQKIMLLRCILQETPLILLDEPLAFLDYPSKINFLEQLKAHCQNTHTCAIISSHEIELSQKYCQKLLWLKDQQQFEWFEQPEKFDPMIWIEKTSFSNS